MKNDMTTPAPSIPEIIAAIREAEAKATPGEWRHVTYAKPENFNEPAERNDQLLATTHRESDPVLLEVWNCDDDQIANLVLITILRNHAIALCDEIERLQKDYDRLDFALRQHVEMNNLTKGNFYLAETRGGIDDAMTKETK